MGQDACADNKAPMSCRLIAFDKAEIEFRNTGAWLVVSGAAPTTGTEVFLSHRIYEEKPDWVGVEVVGALPGCACVHDDGRFEAFMSVSTVVGKKGIEVIGANDTKQVPVKPHADNI